MCKRFTDTNIWEQSWFIDLSPESKNIWTFLEKSCDCAGIWKIDIPEMKRKIGYKNVNLSKFLEEINRDYNKLTGDAIKRNRVILIANNTKLWLTGFISFQYEKGTNGVNANIPAIKGALNRLREDNIFDFAIENGFLRIAGQNHKDENAEESSFVLINDLNINSKGCRGFARDKDKDKDQEEIGFKDFKKEEEDKGNVHAEPGAGAGNETAGENVGKDGNGGRIPDKTELLFIRTWGKPHKSLEEYRLVNELVEKFGFENVEFAFRESVKYNKMTLAYIAAICRKKKDKAEKEEAKEKTKRVIRESEIKAEEQRRNGKCLNLLKDVYGEGAENKLMKEMLVTNTE